MTNDHNFKKYVNSNYFLRINSRRVCGGHEGYFFFISRVLFLKNLFDSNPERISYNRCVDNNKRLHNRIAKIESKRFAETVERTSKAYSEHIIVVLPNVSV